LRTELVEAGPWNTEILLEGTHQFQISINGYHFECHSTLLALKSSYFRAVIASFKTSPPEESARGLPPILGINLLELPRGS